MLYQLCTKSQQIVLTRDFSCKAGSATKTDHYVIARTKNYALLRRIIT